MFRGTQVNPCKDCGVLCSNLELHLSVCNYKGCVASVQVNMSSLLSFFLFCFPFCEGILKIPICSSKGYFSTFLLFILFHGKYYWEWFVFCLIEGFLLFVSVVNCFLLLKW